MLQKDDAETFELAWLRSNNCGSPDGWHPVRVRKVSFAFGNQPFEKFLELTTRGQIGVFENKQSWRWCGAETDSPYPPSKLHGWLAARLRQHPWAPIGSPEGSPGLACATGGKLPIRRGSLACLWSDRRVQSLKI